MDYLFLALFTKAKVGTVPANAPTIDVINAITDSLLVTAGSPTALANMAGAYRYVYSGAADLQLIGLFKTADATVDLQQVPSYTPQQTVNASAQSQAAATAALNAYDPPTDAEMIARTLLAASYATPTNITAGTLTTVTNLTNAATNGDLTATMKLSVNAEVDAALNTAIPGSPTADSINERIVALDAVAAPPTANAIADRVWDQLAADNTVALSTGALLATAGAAADPLLNLVPGSYASGTAGYVLGAINPASVTIVAPVAADGTAISLIYGDDYYNADGRALTFTNLAGPVLTGGTVNLRIQAATVVSIAGVITGAHACYVEATAVQVASLGPAGSVWHYDLEATLVTTSHVVTLVAGSLTIAADVR